MPDATAPQPEPPVRTAPQASPLIRIEGVSKRYSTGRNLLGIRQRGLAAVEDVSLSIFPAETVALVGESGCGKTTLAKLVLRILRPSEGEIYFQNINVSRLSERRLRPWRSKMQLIFQNPGNALPPRRTIFQTLREAMRLGESGQTGTEDQIVDLLEQVGLPRTSLHRYPHTFSGGQKQRIAIARALAVHPHFIVCDEAVSALDTSVQLQIIKLLRELQHRYGIAYLFITHNLLVARHIANRIAVMHQGRIVESAPTETLWNTPRHPYTKMLLTAAPRLQGHTTPMHPSPEPLLDKNAPHAESEGCRFAPMCPLATEICRQLRPRLRPIEDGAVACHEAVE